jgi:site-specific DNA recombinase
MLSAIEEGGHTRGTTERMRELEAREDVLKGLLAEEPTDIPDIHPNVSGIYRKKVERLTEVLNTPEDRNEAAEAIRALVEKITLRPGPNRGEIDATLHGELGTILGWIAAQAVGKTRKRETPAAFATGVSVSVVAGTGFEPVTFRL